MEKRHCSAENKRAYNKTHLSAGVPSLFVLSPHSGTHSRITLHLGTPMHIWRSMHDFIVAKLDKAPVISEGEVRFI